MRVALTGGTGLVGSHLAEALRARGDSVTCLVRQPAAGAPLEALGCRTVTGALEDDRALTALVEGAEIVYHVAGLVTVTSEDALMRVNRDGAARVAAAAARAGVGRLLHVSSLAVTGPTVPGRPLDETGPPRPVTTYGRSKQAGEEVVRASGAAFTIVRPPIVYGPRDRQVLRLFRLARYRVAPVIGDGGKQELSLVHARDLAGALVAAATSERTLGGTYHAAHPDPVTQGALLGKIGEAVGARVRLIPVPAAALKAGLALAGALARLRGRGTLLDPAKAAELLAPAWTCTTAALTRDTGWRASIDLGAGLSETARWYREAGWL